VVELEDEVAALVSVEVVGDVVVEMIAEEDEVVVDVELDATALTASGNAPMPGSLSPSPE
jgi:hypothetical protein